MAVALIQCIESIVYMGHVVPVVMDGTAGWMRTARIVFCEY